MCKSSSYYCNTMSIIYIPDNDMLHLHCIKHDSNWYTEKIL